MRVVASLLVHLIWTLIPLLRPGGLSMEEHRHRQGEGGERLTQLDGAVIAAGYTNSQLRLSREFASDRIFSLRLLRFGKGMTILFRRVLQKLVKVMAALQLPFPQAVRPRFFRNIAERGLDPKMIIDVGANRGHWTLDALSTWPNSQYILLEPQIELKTELDRVCANASNARWILGGASSRDGSLELAVIPENYGCSSSFMVPESLRQAQNYESRSIPVYSLDSICREAGQIPELVKLDAEGMETEIMKGASSLIGVTEMFLLEVAIFDPWPGAATFPEIIKVMDEYGYVPYDFTEFIFRPRDGAVGLVEIAFAKKDGVLRSFKGWD